MFKFSLHIGIEKSLITLSSTPEYIVFNHPGSE